MSVKYIGITIGPILDTLLDASTPAGMWFASFLFSDITRRICQKLTEPNEPLGNVEIYSPYYQDQLKAGCGNTDIFEDGIGKYHDRILLSVTNEFMDDIEEKLKTLIDEVKIETANYFNTLYKGDTSDTLSRETIEVFFKEYLQIHYVITDSIQAENIILEMSDQLSALELMKSFPKENTANPITSLLVGTERGKNELIKENTLFTKIRNKEALLKDADHIRSIEDIARTENAEGLKVGKYFAVVHADGDQMGKTLEKLKNEDLESFSKALFEHASAAANIIQKFGGMTIYAGGDDLLFLAPLLGNDGKTIFSLCDDIRHQFEIRLKENLMDKLGDEPLPTLSFGISSQYYKYPLYEALELSRNFLHDAKETPGKNATVFQLQKHSGQTVYLKIPNENLNQMENFLSIGNARGGEESQQKTEILHSQIYSLEQFKALYQKLIETAMKEQQPEVEKRSRFISLWTHLFDNSDQVPYLAYIEEIASFFYDYCIKPKRCIAYMQGYAHKEREDEVQEKELVFSFSTLLRLKKFYQEKEGERE